MQPHSREADHKEEREGELAKPAHENVVGRLGIVLLDECLCDECLSKPHATHQRQIKQTLALGFSVIGHYCYKKRFVISFI